MKATGIVRRIDDLGRVVIPKEIRRTLKIREGDPLEIFTDKDGEVILKKYSPIGELGDFAVQYAESLHNASGHITCIADRDSIIAVSGDNRKEYFSKPLSDELERIIQDKQSVIVSSKDEKPVSIVSGESSSKRYSSQVVVPIVAEGDPIGAVILLSTEPDSRMGEVESKLAQSASSFLGKQMEQ